MKKAIAYVRVSTTGQAEDGVSLEAQEARIRAWCTLEDYGLADVFIDRGLWIGTRAVGSMVIRSFPPFPQRTTSSPRSKSTSFTRSRRPSITRIPVP